VILGECSNRPPLTLTVERPDEVDASRAVLSDGGLGATHTTSRSMPNHARRVEGEAVRRSQSAPIAETTLLVEDFEPERLAFDLTSPVAARIPPSRARSTSRRAISMAPVRPTSPPTVT
jgi:hypothetical protein